MGSKTCLLDPIPTSFTKRHLPAILPTLTLIINMSLSSGVVPREYKTGVVIPILKKEPGLDVNQLKHYRPITNLPFVAKVLEKIFANQLIDHLTAHGLSDDLQSAYKKCFSTETAVLKVKSDILREFDKGFGVFVAMLDLSSAFDTLDHEILTKRLSEETGINGLVLDWFQSYLCLRKQYVIFEQTRSRSVDLSTGVPQGSILGPLLFSIYMLPLGRIIANHGINRHIYADDTQLYVGFPLKDIEGQHTSLSRLERCIDDVSMWMAVNKLKLNSGKTKFMVMMPQSQTRNVVTNFVLHVDSAVIHPSVKVRNLGTVMDSHLTMENNVSALTQSTYLQMRRIARIRRYLDDKCCATVINSLITSRLDFHNSVLYGVSQCTLRRLQIVQNQAARLLTRTKRDEHITPILFRLHWLPIQQRVVFKILVVTYKCLYISGMPDYLCEMLQFYQPNRTLRSSNDTYKLVVPRTRKTVSDQAFANCAPLLWNSLPLQLRTASSLNSFKSGLKTHLFKQFYNNKV